MRRRDFEEKEMAERRALDEEIARERYQAGINRVIRRNLDDQRLNDEIEESRRITHEIATDQLD